LSRQQALSSDRFRSDLARVLDRVAGELAWGAQVCADIEDALSDLITSSADLPVTTTARIQRLDELRQTLEDLGRLQQQLAHLAEGRDGVMMAVESTIRQESLRRRLNAKELRLGMADPQCSPQDDAGSINWL
jgi:ABC-type transporter Mla subunit MlaD